MSGPAATGRGLLAATLLALFLIGGAGARPLLTVSITSAPSSSTTSTDATFVFSADARGATFTCSLDGARATICRSPVTYRGLPLGPHTFVVTATLAKERATARYMWTIVPPAPKEAWLTVLVDGAGAVVSAPSGISCPVDCTAGYPIGTTVTLTPTVTGGVELKGWAGACAGKGACVVTIDETKFVKATFVPAAEPPDLGSLDRDRDGVGDLRDDCVETAPRMRLVMYGCSTVDLMRDHRLLLDDLYDMPGEYAERFGDLRQLKPVYRGLVRNIEVIRKGAGEVERGDVCFGAATARRGARGVAKTVAGSARLVAELEAGILREPGRVGDTADKDLRRAGLRYRQRLVEDAGKEAVRVRKAFAALCARLGGKRVYVGRVATIDDAQALLRLESGRAFALPRGRFGNGLAEGARARIVARDIRGGPALLRSAVGLDAAKAFAPGLTPCVSLLIAPPQDFTKPNPILHDPLGYMASNRLRLEEGFRVAATPECPAGQDARYSLRVVFTKPGRVPVTVPDLTADDVPSWPLITGGTGTWTITVTLRRQMNSCPPPGEQAPPSTPLTAPARRGSGRTPLSSSKAYPCPVVDIGTTTYLARILPPGAYATATYERTTLSVNENGLDVTRVIGVAVNVTMINPPPSFQAEAYGTVGNDPPFAFKTVSLNQPFGVRPDTWYGNPNWTPGLIRHKIGVDHFAGLVWPRVVGTRQGKPYRYSVLIPKIVTDLLPACPGDNCFYRLPWKAGDVETVTQGNNTPITDPADPPSHCCPPQNFAFDLVLQDGETIYAARGGLVGDLDESNWQNFDPCTMGPSADGPANYVRIDHQDGSYSYYAHVQQNSVIPEVGDRVARGQALALVGNVGRSCGPHLHYQVSLDNTNTIYGQTIPICFEVAYLALPGMAPCFTPPQGQALRSTNG